MRGGARLKREPPFWRRPPFYEGATLYLVGR